MDFHAATGIRGRTRAWVAPAAAFLLLIVLSFVLVGCSPGSGATETATPDYCVLTLGPACPAESSPCLYTYTVTAVYPHASNAWTPGLVIDDGTLYEGTGLYGDSA